jgi:hypothetical protein
VVDSSYRDAKAVQRIQNLKDSSAYHEGEGDIRDLYNAKH